MIRPKPSPVEVAAIREKVVELGRYGLSYARVGGMLGCTKSSIGKFMKQGRWLRGWVVEDIARELGECLANVRVTGQLKQAAQGEKPKEVNMLYEPLRAKTLQHFGWDTDPFKVNVMQDEIWMNKDREYAVQMIEETCDEHGFTALIAPSGSGKSVTLKAALKRLARQKRNLVIRLDPLLNEGLTAGRIIDSMLMALKLPTEGSREHRKRRLADALELRIQEDKRTLVVIEEAQSLHPQALRWLKRVFEMENDDGRRLVGILLVGQPGLRGKASGLRNELELTPELREVAGRLAWITLDPLNEALGDYLRWRIRRAGEKAGGVFSGEAIKAMKDRLNGDSHPMLINVLACRCLNEAADNNDEAVVAKHVLAV